MERPYNQWAGNPSGNPEDKTRCIEELCDRFTFYQCTRKRGHGPNGEHCKQHGKKYLAANIKESGRGE